MKNLILLILVIVIFISCQKDHKTPAITPTTPTDRLKSISLSDTLNMYVGLNRQLPITLTPSDYHFDSLKLESSDTSVIVISSSGVMSAKKVGAAFIFVNNLINSVSAKSLITVKMLPLSPSDSLKAGLIAYYPFNNSPVDSSGNGNNGTIYNVTPTTDRFGNQNSAYYFNGDSSFVTVKDNLALRLSNTDFTINTWIKITQYDSSYGDIIIDKRGHVSSGCWALGMTGSRQFYKSLQGSGILYYSIADDSNLILAGTSRVDSSKWHMVTMIYTIANHQTNMYIDGVLNNSATNIPMPAANNNADIYIGKDNPLDFGGNYFVGKIDDIRIYNRALSLNQINMLYNKTN